MNNPASLKLNDILLLNKEVTRLVNEISGANASHAYIIECADSVVCNSICSIIIKEKLKLTSDPFSHPDVMTAGQEDKKLTVDIINEITIDSYIVPVASDIKIYVINAASETESAVWQHKILKVLEEPPQHSLFLITVTNSNILLPTVRSRASLVSLSGLSTTDAHLVLELDKINNAKLISEVCQGNLSMAYQFNKTNPDEVLAKLFEMLYIVRTSAKSLLFINMLTKYKDNINILLQLLTIIYRDIALFSVNEQLLLLNQYKSDIIKLQFISKVIAAKCIVIINQTKLKLDNNLNFNACIDSMVLQFLEVLNANSGRS